MACCFDGQFWLMHISCGFFFMILIIGCWQCWQVLSGSTVILPVDGALKVALHSGYLSQAMNLPYFPLRSISFPVLHAGHVPTVVSCCWVSWSVDCNSWPISFSFVRNSMSNSVNIVRASFRISSGVFVFSWIFSMSSSKCLVSFSSRIFGEYFSRTVIVSMPSCVAVMGSPLM